MKTKQIGNLTQLNADKGYIHKIGSDTYVKSIIILPEEGVDLYEEVSEIPAFTKSEYDAKVAELVRQRYSESEEFAIQRKAINEAFSPSTVSADSSAMKEYQEYNSFVEECKQIAKNPELYKTEDNG